MTIKKSSPHSPVSHAMLQPLSHEITQIKALALKMLENINNKLDFAGLSDEERQMCDRICGAKNSMAETLVLLADLIIRLTPPAAAQVSAQQEPSLDDGDKALVQAFLKRKRHTKKPSAEVTPETILE